MLFMVCIVHRLLALQKIEREEGSGVDALAGLDSKIVHCVVIGCASAVVHNYAQIRGNHIPTSFTTKPKLHELLFIHNHLVENHCSGADVGGSE